MKARYKHFLIIVVAVVIVYLNVFRNDFVWDDKFFVLEREEIKDLRNVPSFFTQDVEGLYRPVRTVFYALSYALWKDNPIGYHVNSILIHSIVSILVYLIMLKVSGKVKLSFLTGLLFALHPVHTEAVAFITANFDLLGIVFYLLGFLFYLEKGKYYAVSVLFFLLGIFANEFVVTLPLVLVCYDLVCQKPSIKDEWHEGLTPLIPSHLSRWFLSMIRNITPSKTGLWTSSTGYKTSGIFLTYKNMRKDKLKLYAPYFIITALFLFIRFKLIGVFARVEGYQANYFGKLFTMPQVITKYIQILFAPFNLSVDHSVGIASLWEIILFSVIVVLVVYFAFVLRKKSKLASFGVFWFFITLLPVMNIVPIQRMMAEVYLYLPSVGFCMFLAWLIRKIKSAKVWYILILIVVLGSYSIVSINRNTIWKDELSLWSNAVKTNPSSSKAHSNLALELDKRGFFGEAIEEYKESIRLNPNRAKTYFNLGVVYGKIGEVDEAVDVYSTSLELNTDNAEAYNNRGILYAKQNLSELAINDFKNALSLDSEFAQAYVNLGNVYNGIKDYDDAIKAYLAAVNINPNIAEVYYNLGVVYSKIGRDEDAKRAFDKAYGLNPNLHKNGKA